jgi:hypothetical protein
VFHFFLLFLLLLWELHVSLFFSVAPYFFLLAYENFGEKDSWQTVGVFIFGGRKICFCSTLSVRVGILFVGVRESWLWVHNENLYKGHNNLTKLNVNTSSIWLRFAFECVIWPWWEFIIIDELLF